MRESTGLYDNSVWAAWPSPLWCVWAAWPFPLWCASMSVASVSGPLGAFWFEPNLIENEGQSVPKFSALRGCPSGARSGDRRSVVLLLQCAPGASCLRGGLTPQASGLMPIDTRRLARRECDGRWIRGGWLGRGSPPLGARPPLPDHPPVRDRGFAAGGHRLRGLFNVEMDARRVAGTSRTVEQHGP